VAGVLIDMFGRKVPLVIGFAVAGLSMGCIPLFTSLYPGYLVLRTLIGLGITIA
jgi:MFS family permease